MLSLTCDIWYDAGSTSVHPPPLLRAKSDLESYLFQHPVTKTSFFDVGGNF